MSGLLETWRGWKPWEKAAMVAVAAVLLLGSAVWVANAFRAGPAGDDPWVRAEGAKIACQDMVRDQLKSPASAKFSDVTASGIGPWTVRGRVDSDNSFGASVRNSWECTVRLEGDVFRGSAAVL